MTCIKTKIGVCALAIAAATLARAQSPSDADVLGARDAAQRGNWRAVEAHRARLAGHLLEAYASYWLLAGNLERADPGAVQAFFARYPGTPLAESLRREWLKALGASGSWELFRAEYPRVQGDEVEIACYSFQERLARNDPEAAAEALSLFASWRETAAACDPVFAAIAAAGRIGENQVWERIRRMLSIANVKEAKRLNALLPKRSALHEKTLDRSQHDPVRFLAQEKLRPLTRAGVEMAIFAIARLARNKPDEAAERLAALAPPLGPEATRYAWGQVAWQAATNHHPRALEWYANAGSTTLTDTQVAWKARAAMRAGDWKELLAAIQALSPEEARDPSWRYWRARALRSLGETAAAEALMRTLPGQQSFYSLLAAEDLGVAAPPEWNGWHPAQADLERIRSQDGIQRALELYRLGLDNEALREWQWAIRGLDDRGLLAAAEVARLANEPERAINTAERTLQVHDFAQRFPTPHRESLAGAARQWDLDESMLYGLVRQESRFVADARSRVGATGLMQLMPATARWVARQIPVQPYKSDMLVRPEVNLLMGTYYFRRVLNDLGHPVLATAAYNAGPGRARRWRDDRALEGAIYVETIPFVETRDYVKKVVTNAWYYRHRLTGKTASLRDLLGTIPGRNGDTSVASNIP